MSALRKNVASQHIGFVLTNSTTGAPVTAGGAGNIVIDGGAQAACAGTFTHKGTGQWDYAPTQAETNGTSICFAFTGTSAIQVGMQLFTIGYDPTQAQVPANVTQWNGTNVASPATPGVPDINVKNFNNVSAPSLPTNFTSLSITAAGLVATTSNIKKNTASAGFTFLMTDATTHTAKTGLTVTSVVSIDGAAFVSTTNSVVEVANGTYKIDLAAADVNGNHIMLAFTASGADQLNVEIITQP